MSGAPSRLVVVGGGITGLAAAYEAVQRARQRRVRLEVTVLEAANRVGGKVLTETREGALLEGGPDSFVTSKPHLLDLISELGLSGELLKTDPANRGVFVYSGGRLHALPSAEGFWPRRLLPWIGSGLLSWKAKARIALEPWMPVLEGDQDESLADFTRRRLGEELLDKLVGPVLAGIYAGDAETLSLRSTFPQLKEMERRGGVLRGAAKAASGKPDPDRSLFMTLKGGLSRLTETLAARLPPRTVRTGAAVTSIRRRGGAWQINLAGGEALFADAVIAAAPANILAGLIGDLDLELASILREIPFVSTATVSLAYEKKGFPHPLAGYGFLVPRSEKYMTSAATFTSSKFPGRVPDNLVLIRAFLGGAGREEGAEADEATVARTARHELRQILGLGDLHPKITRVNRWLKANPQYTVGHGMRLTRLESCLKGHPGLYLAGASYDGPGLPDCARSGREAARRAVDRMPASALENSWKS